MSSIFLLLGVSRGIYLSETGYPEGIVEGVELKQFTYCYTFLKYIFQDEFFVLVYFAGGPSVNESRRKQSIQNCAKSNASVFRKPIKTSYPIYPIGIPEINWNFGLPWPCTGSLKNDIHPTAVSPRFVRNDSLDL